MANFKNISVVGAGITGSLLAHLLAEQGNKVDLFDTRSPDQLPGRGRANEAKRSTISERGISALYQIGLRDVVKGLAEPLTGYVIHSPDGGTRERHFSNRSTVFAISDASICSVLLFKAAAHANVYVTTDIKCEVASSRPDGAEVKFSYSGTPHHFYRQTAAVFGTDINATPVKAAIVSQSGDSWSEVAKKSPHASIQLSIPRYTGQDLDQRAIHIWQSEGEGVIEALPNGDGSFTCTLILNQDRLRSLIKPTAGLALEHFMETNFPDLHQRIPDIYSQGRDAIISTITSLSCGPWHDTHGRMIILGDGVHKIAPLFGQSLDFELQTCLELMRHLGQAHGLGEDGMLPEMQRFYQARRREADALSELAERDLNRMLDPNSAAVLLRRKELEHILENNFPDRFTSVETRINGRIGTYSEIRALDELCTPILERALSINQPVAEVNIDQVLADVESAIERSHGAGSLDPSTIATGRNLPRENPLNP